MASNDGSDMKTTDPHSLREALSLDGREELIGSVASARMQNYGGGEPPPMITTHAGPDGAPLGGKAVQITNATEMAQSGIASAVAGAYPASRIPPMHAAFSGITQTTPEPPTQTLQQDELLTVPKPSSPWEDNVA